MSSFTKFTTKPDWLGCCLNNRIMDSDQENSYVSGFNERIMNGVYSYA